MVFEQIRDIIVEKIDVAPELVLPESSFENMKVDSLYMVEIMLEVEDKFNIIIDDAEGLETVADLVAYVEKQMA